MTKPHVAIVCTAHPISDNRMFVRWAKGLLNLGWRVSFIGPVRGVRPDIPEGIKFIEVADETRYLRRALGAKRVLPHLNRIKPDVVIFPDPELFPVLLGYGRKSGALVIFDRHENFEQSGTLTSRGGLGNLIAKSYSIYEHLMAPRLGGVIVVLEEMIDNLNPATNVVVVHNFPARHVAERLAKPRTTSIEFTCVNLGAVHVSRGLYEQLEVSRQLVNDRKRTDFRFCLGGNFDPGSFEKSQEFIKQHKLGDNLTLIPKHIAHDTVLDYFRKAQIGFSPYLDNAKAKITMQNKILEFMAAGMPIITSPSSMNGRLVENSGCGKLHWANETEAIADTIEQWMDDPAAASELGKRGQDYLFKHCLWETDLEKAERWMLDMLSSTR